MTDTVGSGPCEVQVEMLVFTHMTLHEGYFQDRSFDLPVAGDFRLRAGGVSLEPEKSGCHSDLVLDGPGLAGEVTYSVYRFTLRYDTVGLNTTEGLGKRYIYILPVDIAYTDDRGRNVVSSDRHRILVKPKMKKPIHLEISAEPDVSVLNRILDEAASEAAAYRYLAASRWCRAWRTS